MSTETTMPLISTELIYSEAMTLIAKDWNPGAAVREAIKVAEMVIEELARKESLTDK